MIGTAAIALGSYVVHTGRMQGNLPPMIPAAVGGILISVGIMVVLAIAAGLYGAMSLSKSTLRKVCLNTKQNESTKVQNPLRMEHSLMRAFIYALRTTRI